jgi:phosphate acyltransferase
MLTIALDAMGGDHAPKAEVEGAIRAAKSLGVRILLVGREDALKQELANHREGRSLPIEIVHAPDVIDRKSVV